MEATRLPEPKIEEMNWQPSTKPDPQKILWEAKDDTSKGDYEQALAKFVWFHENALKIEESFYGVRLSFALCHWDELARKHPPALTKLESIRDENEKAIREGKANSQLFDDFRAINERLDQDFRTVQTFEWLDRNNADICKKVYHNAEPALVAAGKYSLCGRYLADADKKFQAILKWYEEGMKSAAEDKQFGEMNRNFYLKQFSHESATMVALLILNDRKEEADCIAAKALQHLDGDESKTQMTEALRGVPPTKWP